MEQSPGVLIALAIRRTGSFCLAALCIVAHTALADSITTTGRTDTSVTRNGNVIDVSTSSVHGVNAYNDFGRFNVAGNETVNLFIPDQAQNLLNLIRDETSTIDGMVNSWLQGQLGGNVFFLNPHGIVIGADGQVNVGNLTLVTPTQAFMDEFFDSALTPSAASTLQVLEGQVPIDPNGLITVHGHVLATGNVSIDAGAVTIGGSVQAGGAGVSLAMSAADLINLDGVDAATGLTITESGSVRILAAGDVINAGEIRADGAHGVDAGVVTIHAGGDLTMAEGSSVSARGDDVDSNGGVIDLFAGNTAYLQSGASIDARAGLEYSDGGSIEFSAQHRVVLDGGQFDVSATDGSAGSVLIDPEEIEVLSSNLYLNGGDFSLEATESLTVNPDVVISTRSVADPVNSDHATAVSTGDSGNLSLTAPQIVIADGAALYAHAINNGTNYVGGDIALGAARVESGTAHITLTNADVRGANVSFDASVNSETDVLDLLALNATAVAGIDIDASTIVAANSFSATTSATINAQTGLLPLPVSSIDANAAATVDITGASSITTNAGGNVILSAESNVTTDATPNSFLSNLPGDVAVGRSDVNSDAIVHVGGDTQINSGGSVTLMASNAVDATAVADASAAGASAAGAAVAVSVVNATTMATVDGNAGINATGALSLLANSSIESRALASAAAEGASFDMDGDSEGAQTLSEYSDEASTSDGGVQVAGAVAVGDIDNTTQASLGSTLLAQSGERATISSLAHETSTVTGDGSAASGMVGVGVGVAINIARSENYAFVDQDLSAIGIDLIAGDGTTSTFETSATAGAGASNVGVAGALAVNVLDDLDSASIRSGTVDVGAGDLNLSANSNTSSSAAAKPVEDGGATGDSLGLGASVAMNIAAHSAQAIVGDGVAIDDVNNVSIFGTGRHDVVTEAEAGAQGGVAITPVLALSLVDNETIVRLEDGAALLADGTINLRADHRGTLKTTAKGSTEGETAAIGGAFAISTITDIAQVAVTRDLQAGNAVTLSAFNGSTSESSATASAGGGDDDDDSGDDESGGVDQAVSRQQTQADMVQTNNGVGNDTQMDDQETPSAESSEGKVNLAAAVSVNVASSSATAELADGINVSSGGRLTVQSSNNTDGKANTDASAVGGDAQVGIGAAVAINSVASHNSASIGNGEFNVNGLTVRALMTDLGDGDTTNTAEVSAMSGAGGSNVGVAGSLALNLVDASTLAQIADGAQVNAGGGDVLVTAQHASLQSASAMPTEDGGASGGKVGVGASVALNLGDGQSTISRVGDNVALNDASSLTVSADGTYDVTTEAKAGAEGGVAIDAVVALAVLDETTQASVGEGAQLVDLDGNLVIDARSSGTRSTSANADIQSESVGVGAAAAVVNSTSRTSATLNRDVAAAGSLQVSAMSDRRYDTVAIAGARGADMEAVEEPSEQRDNTTSTSTLDDTSDAQEGGKDGGKVSVAAAVAVSVMDDDVDASVTGGRTLTSGGDISVDATNLSNFSSRGRGDAVDPMVAVGIGVGVGLSIARNDTLARLDDGMRIVDVDAISVLARSEQNTAEDYIDRLAAEAIAGAGAKRVGVAGAFGVVYSQTTTRASVGEIVVENADSLTVAADNTSKLAAKAWSGAVGRVGVGASVATVYSDNEYAATIAAGSDLTLNDLSVTATNHVIDGDVPFDITNFLNLTQNNLELVLGTNNYYAEAIAGSGGTGVAVSGAFAVNIFNDVIRAEVEAPEQGGTATTINANGSIEVASRNEVRAKAFAGALAASSKVGVGVSSADIFNSTRSISSIAGNISGTDVSVLARSDQDFVAFGVSGAGAGNTGAAGAANVIVSQNDVHALIAEDSNVTASNNVIVAADNVIDLTNIAGGAAGGGTAGVGISAVVNVIDNATRAQIGRNALVVANSLGDATTVAAGDANGSMLGFSGLAVTATATEDLFTIAAGGAGGGSAGVAGSGAVNVLGVSTIALIAEGVMINDSMIGGLDQSVYVMASDHTDSFTVAGAASGGGSAGIGAGADVSVTLKDTQAAIQAADVRARGNVAVAARSSEDIRSIAATVGIGGSAGVAGSVGVQVVDVTTRAFIGQDVDVLDMPTTVIAEGSVVVEAENATQLDLLAGGVSGGGSAGIGASATVAVVDKTTEAFIGSNSRVDALALRAPVDAATGRFMISRVAPSEDEGRVRPAGGDNNADLTGDGGNDIDNEALTTERQASAGRDSFSGVAVTATNRDDIATIAASGGGAGSVAVNVSGSVVIVDADTTARVAKGATVNATQGADAQSVRVAANNDFQRLGVAAAASVAGAVGVTPGADITIAVLDTLATIDNAATVNAGGDVEVLATSSEDALSVSVGAAGSGTVAVGGAVSVVSIDSRTHALIGADATDASEAVAVDAGGNVIVAADDRTDSLLIAGSLGVGIGAVGVGGSIGVTTISKDTRALIGNFASVSADGDTANLDNIALDQTADVGPLQTRDSFSGLLVQATSSEDISSIAASAAAGFYAGLAGGVSIQVIDSDTTAAIGANAVIDAGAGGGSEALLVAAANQYDGFGFGGGLGGGIVGIGGGVDIGVVKNDTSASVGASSVLTSSGDLTVLARSGKDVHSIAASAAGGIGAVAGSVSVWSLGSGFDDSYSVDEDNQETGQTTTRTDTGVDDDGLNSTTAEVDNQGGQFAALLNGYDDPDMNTDAMDGLQRAMNDVNNAQAGTVAADALADASVAAGTSAVIGAGAAVSAGDDLRVQAVDHTDFRVDAGSVSVGGVGIGAAIAVASMQNASFARVDQGATLAAGADADDDLLVIAQYIQSANGFVAAGTAGGVALGAQVLVLSDQSAQRATLEDDVHVTRAGGGVNVEANAARSASLNSAGASVGGVAAGVSVAVADFGGGSTAQLAAVDIDTLGGVAVSARVADNIDVATQAVAAGADALTGAFAVALSDATVLAAITDGALIVTDGAIDVAAISQSTTAANATGVSVAIGVAGGASVAIAHAAPNVSVTVDDNVTLEAGDDVVLRARHNTDENGSALAGTGAQADAFAGAGGLSVGAAGAIADADSAATVRVAIANDTGTATGTTLLAGGDVRVDALASNTANASTIGVGLGLVGVGISVADADANGTVEAFLAANRVTGGNVFVNAGSVDVATAATIAGAGGIIAGSGAVATANIDSSTTALTGDGVELISGNAVGVTAATIAHANAESRGISGGALAVGVSRAVASTTPRVVAGLGDATQLTAQTLDVRAERHLPAGNISALASATGSSGGLVGVNATESRAQDDASVTVEIGDGSNLAVAGIATLIARNASRQDAISSSVAAGIIAAGANVATANSDNATTVRFGQDSNLLAEQLVINAVGQDVNYADSTAGSGGIISGSAATAQTQSTANTLIDTGTGNLIATDLSMLAAQTLTFDSRVNSVNASLLGASGANTHNIANSNVTTRVGANGMLMADNIALVAANTVHKDRWGAGNGWNVSSGSGGAIDAPAARTLTRIAANTLVDIGTGASVLQSGDRDAPGRFTLDASNAVVAYDRVQMNSGGAVSIAKGESKTLAEVVHAGVNIGTGALLSSVGDLEIGTRSVGDVRNAVAVDTYGLAGAPRGETTSRFVTSNRVDIGQNARVNSLRDIMLGAGVDSSGERNRVNTASRTDLWNNTVVPINGTPDADASIVSNNAIAVAVGAEIAAVRDARLLATSGSTRASGVGIAKDIYREALAAVASAISNAFGGGDVSFDIHGGSRSDSASSAVTVDGSVRVGTESRLELTFDTVDGNVVEERRVNGVVVGPDEGIQTIGSPQLIDIAQDILDRINELYALVLDYTADNENSSAAIAARAYESEIAFLERKLEDMGFPVSVDPNTGERLVGFTGSQMLSPQDVADARIARMMDDIDQAEMEQEQLTQENTTLEAQNDQLTSDNMTLDMQNMTLADLNAMLMSENAALEMNIVALMALQAALDPDSPTFDADFAALQAMIDADQSMIDENDIEIADNDMTIAGNNTTIASNTDTINMNLVTVSMNTSEIMNLDASIMQLNVDIMTVEDGGPYSDQSNGGPVAEFRTIDDVTAQLGNIYIESTDLRGGGILEAPGNALISIVNNTPTFLRLNDLIIPSNTGGKLFVNNVDVTSNAAINAINRSDAGANFNITTGASTGAEAPVIEVISRYDPLDSFYVDNKTPTDLPPLAPDVIVSQDSVISNLLGSVTINMAAGNIRIEQNTTIAGNEINIETRNGDFVQSYTEGFTHVNAAPLVSLPGTGNEPSTVVQQTQAGQGIVANGSVLLAGRYLNVNGTVQSGIPEWGVVIPSASAVRAADGTVYASFGAARAYYATLVDPPAGAELFQVLDASLSGLPGGTQGTRAQISVNFNAQANRLELAGVQVQGGYIELFGQIFNTNEGVGRLRVLDGFGQVRVNNTSGLPLMLNVLDAGRGVQGQIRITNILDDETIADTLVFERGPGAPRTGMFYDPQTGLRFDTIAGSNDVTRTRYIYSQDGWFGFDTGVNQLNSSYIVSGPNSVSDPLTSGSFLRLDPMQTANLVEIDETLVTSETVIAGASWRDCNWWTLCINSTHFREYYRTVGSTNLNGFSVTADYGIPIEFIGFDEGLIDVASNGAVLINGSLNNPGGDTRITSTGPIEQLSASAILSGVNIDLFGTSIGDRDQFVRIAGLDGGALNATAASGDLFINQLTGIMNVGAVNALNGTVVLAADNDILGVDSLSLVSANRVELNSRNGAIGSGSAFEAGGSLSIATGSTSSLDPDERARFGLVADARDNVKIINTNGDLMVIDVQSGADVRLEATGSIVDNNPVSRTDERTQDELIELWDSMRLRGQLAEDKAADEIRFFENGVTQDYRTYWTQRNRQSDPSVYDPSFAVTLSAAQESAIRDQLVAQGRTQAQIDAALATYAEDRTSEYHQLHERLYDPASGDAVDGAIPTTFVVDFRYSASDAEITARTTGSSWEQFQLELPVAAGLLKEITDTVTEVKDPNIRGGNVVLVAGQSVGFNEAARVIDLSQGLDALDRADRAAIAAAERGDVTVMGDILEIIKRTPVNIEHNGEGALRVTALDGYAYLGSELDLMLDQVLATGDVRIKVAGSLLNGRTDALPNVLGDTIILEAARGNIGAADAPIGIEMGASGAFVARAMEAIHARTTAGDFRLDTLYSRGDVFLTSGGSILDAFDNDDLNLLGSSIYLEADGSIGHRLNPLDVSNDPLGIIEATSGPGAGIFLNVPEGTARFGALMSGAITNLSSSVGYTIDGLIQGPGSINLSAVRNIDMGDNGALVSGGELVSVIAGSLTMADSARVDAAGNVIIEVDDREIENADGSTTIVPGGAVLSTVTAGDDVDITAGSGGLSVTQALTAGGSARVTAGAGGARFATVSVGDNLSVVSTADVAFDSATSGGATAIEAGGDLSIVEQLTSGGPLAIDVSGAMTGARVHSGGGAAIDVAGQINLDTVIAAGDLAIAALGVDINDVSSGGSASVDVGADGVRLGAMNVTNDVTVDSAAGVAFDTLSAGGAVSVTAVGDVGSASAMPATLIADSLAITSMAGAIGSQALRLEIEVVGNVTLNAFNDIGVHERSGDLLADLIVSQNGTVDLLVSDGAADLGLVSAPEDIIIQTAGGLTANQIRDAATVILGASDEGAEVAVDRLSVGRALTVMADAITLPNVDHFGRAGRLQVDLSGNDGGFAQMIEFVADSAVGVDFLTFKTRNFEMAFSNDLLNFEAMEIGDFGRLVTPRHNIVIDNVNRVLYPSATAQLYALNEPLDLRTTNDNLIFTTARIVDYDPFYIVNQFSTENSLVRLVPKRLTLWERMVRQMTVPALGVAMDEEQMVIDPDSYASGWIEGVPSIPIQLD